MADTLNTKTVVIEPEMLDIIAELDEFKGAWRALSTLAPERLSALRRVATIESIGSSTRIEGSKLSDQDVEKLLSNVETRSFETRDEQEVAGYAGVMETIFASWSVLPAPGQYSVTAICRPTGYYEGRCETPDTPNGCAAKWPSGSGRTITR